LPFLKCHSIIDNKLINNLTKLIMKKISMLIFLASNFSNILYAQDEKEVMLFSQYQPMSTARSLSLGGAMGSVGADFGALCINPATLGKYSKGEFTFTPTFRANGTSTTYNEKTSGDDKTKISIDNIGFISANRRTQKSGWKAKNIAFGMNRVANFNRNTVYNGTNTKSSMVVQYAQAANDAGGYGGLGSISLLGQMAAYVRILDTVKNDPTKSMFSFIPTTNGINQSKNVSETGGIHELNLSVAANNNDQLLLGAGIGIPILHYSRTTNYQEEDLSGNKNNDFDSWQYTERLTTSGAGINIKVGAIYMPIPSIRLGVALHSPTYYSLSEEGDNEMSAKLENFISNKATEKGEWKSLSEYNLATPYRAVISGSAVIGKLGFISADYEYLDYRTAKINTTESAFNADVNNAVKKLSTTANNIKLGAEVRLQSYSIRAGYAMFGSQFNANQFDASKKDLSFGLGYRGESFFSDIAFVNSKFADRDFLYQINGVNLPAANIANTFNTFALTIGWKY
jgi:hypothetical protein